MTDEARIRIFDSQGQDYKQAFQIFLDHTDQKRNARKWLERVVSGLQNRRAFIDAGGGERGDGQDLRRFLQPDHRD